VIFSRNRGNAGRHKTDGKGRHVRGRTPDPELTDEFDDDLELDEGDDTADAGPAERGFGPYDVSEAPDDGQERLDLGALRIPAIGGVEIQMQAGADGVVQQVMLVHEESRLQLAACAAPRSEGIWDELRDTLRTSMAQAGARQEDASGDYGPELKATLRDGTSSVDIRHVGIDGPRWFVHAVFIGAAATDPSQAGPLGEALRGLIVDRGTDARPVGEPLPLRLPPQAAAHLAAQVAANDPAAGTGAAPEGAAGQPAASDQPAATDQPPAANRPATTRPTRTSGRGTPARGGSAGRGTGRPA
jgi:hypothetical protein